MNDIEGIHHGVVGAINALPVAESGAALEHCHTAEALLGVVAMHSHAEMVEDALSHLREGAERLTQAAQHLEAAKQHASDYLIAIGAGHISSQVIASEGAGSQRAEREVLQLSSDMRFAVRSVVKIGDKMIAGRLRGLVIADKDDLTKVSDVDIGTNREFNTAVQEEYKGTADVRGEELSQTATQPTDGPKITWTVDTVDGTLEYVADYRDRGTGDPIDPTKPLPPGVEPEPIPDDERTSCAAAAMFKGTRLWLSAVYNPFTDQLLIADRDLGGTFRINRKDFEAGTVVQGERLEVSTQEFDPADAPWDAAVWEGAPVDVSLLQEALGPPRNNYSAISQAADVAAGKSVGAVFAGNTLHDIAPAVALVMGAQGVVAKPDGKPVTMDNLLDNMSAGFVYTSARAHRDFMHAFRLGKDDNLYLVEYGGILFPATAGQIRDGLFKPEEIVRPARKGDKQQEDLIIVQGFGPPEWGKLTKREVAHLQRLTRQMGVPRWRYSLKVHANGRSLVGFAHLKQPDSIVTIEPQDGEGPIQVRVADLITQVLQAAVAYKIRAHQPDYIQNPPQRIR